MALTYKSVCSGIEAATLAWHPLGWRPVSFSEVDPFCSALLAHHYPDILNLGDFTQESDEPHYDVLVGGTPCQGFSVAGLRKGLDDDRSNLALGFIRVAHRQHPKWFVWENVPGVLSSNEGEDFGCFLSGLTGVDVAPPPKGWKNSGILVGDRRCYSVAWRVLDAQWFGVAQRRRRVFVVGHLGDWRAAAAVLFEQESLSGNPAPSREKREDVAGSPAIGIGIGGEEVGYALRANPSHSGDKGDGGVNCSLVAIGLDEEQNAVVDGFGCLKAREKGGGFEGVVAHSLRGEGFDASEDGTGRETPLVPQTVGTLSDGAHMGGGLNGQDAYSGRIIPTLYSIQSVNMVRERKQNGIEISEEEVMYTVTGRDQHAVAMNLRGREGGAMPEISDVASLRAASGGGSRSYIVNGNSTPETACEMAFPLRADDGSGNRQALQHGMAVRRLTPRECERLQGIPDDYTLIPYRNKLAADGPRYKSIGNSFAVPVVRWIGRRLEIVDAIMKELGR